MYGARERSESNNFDLTPNDSDLIDLDSQQVTYQADFSRGGEEAEDLHLQQPMTSAGGTPVQSSYTTCQGDGLLIDPSKPSVFDEIQDIIDGKDEAPKVVKKLNVEQKNDPFDISNLQHEEQAPEFNLEDIPENLKPTSILLEVIDQVERLKEDL